ncbi:hypothetical protein IAR55_006888 [Kwoniella newhampshirensis]|uniref:Phosphatidylinositol glycan, class S n=1 Tax=Kwoniella newhampshirensis TaxID=1651941 RepID=A0AAW0YTW3_9TREE
MSVTGPKTANSSPSRIRKTPAEVTAAINPSTKRRLWITLSFPLLIVLAIPFWWYVTSIERIPLPESRIAALENATLPSIRPKILFTADVDAFPTPPPGRAVFEHKVILQSLAREVLKGIDGIYEQRRPKKLRNWDLVYDDDKREHTPLRLHIRRWEHANTSWPLEPYVQASETGLMTSGIKGGTLVIPVHPSQIGDRFLKQHYKIAIINSLLGLYPPDPPEIPLRALKYSPNITLSFVLLNEDSSEGSYVRSWDIEGAIRDHLLPHLELLSPIFNFTIESQLLYHAPLTFEPTYNATDAAGNQRAIDAAIETGKGDEENAKAVAKELADEQTEKAWIIDEEQMKVFVNSERWSLDSGSTNNPVLRFLLYVPAAKHRPMRLSTPDSAQSFLLPQFGGVVLLNPPPSTPSASTYHLPFSALTPAFHLFTQHLYSLLALPPTPDKIHPSPPPTPLHAPSSLIQPITPWQVHQVLLARTRENSEEARKTLMGIVRLVKKIREMKVGQVVRGKVLGAVERLEQLSSNNTALEMFILTRDAVGLANQAFFDPTMMGLLYFPDEHKFAVYTPLFAPIAVPLILGLIKEFLAWKRRRGAKRQTMPTASGSPVARDRELEGRQQTVNEDASPAFEQTEVSETQFAGVELATQSNEANDGERLTDLDTATTERRSLRSRSKRLR